VARRIDRNRYTATTVEEAVAGVLGDGILHRRVRELGQRVRMEDGAAVAAGAIDHLLDGR
ncbi:MAG TPA: hypothetical protein VER37_00245, partial [Thermomicrobiales bacterium]|nr:hypothetical protein [Thermomicrobiales bacterium]